MEYNRSYFKGKTAIVTGGASGIGLALCEELLKSDARSVVMVDVDKENLEFHEKRLEELYPTRVKGLLCDVTSEPEVKRVIDGALFFGEGELDLLINCAGAGFNSRFIDEPRDPGAVKFYPRTATDAIWKKAMELNLNGARYGCEAAIPIMLKAKKGQIVNIISGVAFTPMPYQGIYAATKAALNAMTLALRKQYKSFGIDFNSATPGTTATPMFEKESPDGKAPPDAQSPLESAQRILNGVARNEPLILGDEPDRKFVPLCFLPDEVSHLMDESYIDIARQRRTGKMSFKSEDRKEVDLGKYHPVFKAIMEDEEENILPLLKQYIAQRENSKFDRDYYRGKRVLIVGDKREKGRILAEKLLEYGAEKVILGNYRDIEDEKVDLLIYITDLHGEEERGIGGSDEWEKAFRENLFDPIGAYRDILPRMLREKKGQIVSIMSMTAVVPRSHEIAYSSAQAAINMLTQVLRYEYWDCGISFNSVLLGEEEPFEKSVLPLLRGVAKNDRIICGDDSVLMDSILCFNPLMADRYEKE